VIRSFEDKRTEALYEGENVADFQAIISIALRKLDMLDAAIRLQPPHATLFEPKAASLR
jgi:plasmid maintenance system killer protein